MSHDCNEQSAVHIWLRLWTVSHANAHGAKYSHAATCMYRFDCLQAAMNAIMAAVRSGIAPSVVHSMVDVAAAALRVTAPLPTPASPTRHRTLPADTLHPPADHPSQASPRPTVSSPRQPHSELKRRSHLAVKSALKPAAVREHNVADRAESDAAAARAEAPAMFDAPYR